MSPKLRRSTRKKEQKAADAQKAAEEKERADRINGYRLGHLRSFRRLGTGRSRYEELLLSVVRRGADLRCINRRDCLPLLRKPQRRARSVYRQLKARFCPALQASKDDAVKALKAHYKGKPFLPRAFTAENHVQEIKGVYVPFWMFDGEAEGSAQYEATRSRSFTSGDYEVTETDHFDVYREGSLAFSRVPVDASSKMPDDYMDSIEPFDYDDLKPVSTAYLPGFLCRQIRCLGRRQRRPRRYPLRRLSVSALARSATGYDSCVPVSQDVKLHRGKVHYALLPV